jgi:uncharacterized protein (DUF885 family)
VTEASKELAQLSEEFFVLQNTLDPLSATLLGINGYDHLLPDPSREGSARGVAALRDLEARVSKVNVDELSEAERVNAAVLARLAWGARIDLEEGIWETDASSESYSSPHSMVFMCVPSASVVDDASRDAYLTRLSGLGAYFDAITERFRTATGEGRLSTRVGVTRSLDQLNGHLELSLEEDTLANPNIGPEIDREAFLATSRSIVENSVRPAVARLSELFTSLLDGKVRDDEHVGLLNVPKGDVSYALAVRRQTTTDLTPEQIHQIGLDRLAELDLEWAELGEKVLGERDVPTILSRLREDRSLRFTDASQIVDAVTGALERAEAARDDWFPPYRIAECTIEEIHPIEAKSAALAHYVSPATDGSRPGTHWVLTINPEEKFTYEYEALAFHESTPGHHLQIATGQTLTDLPDYRRYLDAQLCGFIEGWGLYSERLADEMGLYTSDLARLGMLSFDALRACRLVVDTGMHFYNWSRQQAVDFMWSHTATTAANVANEIDRYIGWPGQALAYMIGRLEIGRLREDARGRLGDAFDVRAFHGIVLGSGAVPLDVLGSMVERWINQQLTPV